MPVPEKPVLKPVIRTAVKMAVGGSCEWCRERFPLSLLEIHKVYDEQHLPEPVRADPQKGVLVLCPICHRIFHENPIPLEDQKEVIWYRPRWMKQELRRILGYVPRKYIPPDTIDPATCYEDCFRMDSLDLYRAGG